MCPVRKELNFTSHILKATLAEMDWQTNQGLNCPCVVKKSQSTNKVREITVFLQELFENRWE